MPTSTKGCARSAFVMAWMCGGLLITGAIAWAVATNERAVEWLTDHSILYIGLLVGELACVLWLSLFVQRMSDERDVRRAGAPRVHIARPDEARQHRVHVADRLIVASVVNFFWASGAAVLDHDVRGS